MNSGYRGRADLQREPVVSTTSSQNRARNILAVVRMIVRRTAENSPSVEHFASHVEGRINAYARAISDPSSDLDRGIELSILVADTLLAYGIDEGTNATISGPSVRLHGKVAETLSLALFELATNAIEHGAIEKAGSRVHVTWTADSALKITWLELGRPAIAAVNNDGFGFRFLKHGLPYELSAETTCNFAEETLSWNISIPASSDWEKDG